MAEQPPLVSLEGIHLSHLTLEMLVGGLGFTSENLDREVVIKLKYRGVTYEHSHAAIS
jgi:hypothetical protein